MAVDLAVAKRAEEPLDFRVADRTPESDSIDVVDRHEHRRLVGHNAEVVKTARRAENRLLLDAFDDAETMIRVNDLVTDLKCHRVPRFLGS